MAINQARQNGFTSKINLYGRFREGCWGSLMRLSNLFPIDNDVPFEDLAASIDYLSVQVGCCH